MPLRFLPLPTKKSDPDLYPHRHGLYFAFFNALNWQVATGAPLVLFMEYLGANSFQTGLVYGWTLLLTPVQVFATMLLPVIGFKRLTMAGWGTRSIFLLVPLLIALFGPDEPVVWATNAMVVAMFFYSLSRSVGAAAITTWLHALVPDSVRGRYWATDQMMVGIAAVGTLVVCAAMFVVLPARWAFFAQYAISVAGAWLALRQLKVLPDVERPTVMNLRKIVSDTPRHLFGAGEFRSYLWLTVAFFVVTTPLAPFSAYYLKATAGLTAASIMVYTMLQYSGVIAGNWFMRSRIDVTGTKPFFQLSFVGFVVIAAGWLGCLRLGWPLSWAMPVLYFLLGIATGMFTAANVNYLAKVLPASDRALPLSLHGALTALLGGISPVMWGLFLKGGDGEPAVNETVFAMFFAVTLAGSIVLWLLAGRLVERAGHVDPVLGGSWLLRPFRAMTNLINLAEWPPKRVEDDDRPR